MATTTNYGWTTPDDTALVKDGASAIRSLGTSIDTTTKNLNPSTTLGDLEYRSSTSNTNTRIPIGTSGQALTVVAGVPSWANSATSVLTTTGDLLYASAANTLARRAIGSTGDVLTVSGGLPTWATPSSGGMTLISTTSLSGTSVITLSSIPQTYVDLRIVLFGLTWDTGDALPSLRPNGSATSFTYAGARSSGTANARVNTEFWFTEDNWDRTNSANCFVFDFYNYASTAAVKSVIYGGQYMATGGTTRRAQTGAGGWNSTAAISSMGIYVEGRNVTAGTALLYGVK